DRAPVDEQPPAPPRQRPGGGQLPESEAERLHRVGHHLLVAHGDVEVVLPVVGHGNGEQRGDRPALDDLELLAHKAPLDVLGPAQARFAPPSSPPPLRVPWGRHRFVPTPLRSRTSPTTCPSVSTVRRCRSGSTARARVPPPG